jgi:hypothetical protein
MSGRTNYLLWGGPGLIRMDYLDTLGTVANRDSAIRRRASSETIQSHELGHTGQPGEECNQQLTHA